MPQPARHYSVNAETQTTLEKKLAVRVILETAGFAPATDYRLTRNNGNQDLPDYDEEVPIHDGEAFTATFLGTTPTS
jgi:hypothetical protein